MLYDIDGCRWGCQIQNKEQRYEWFKLGLDPSMQRQESSRAMRYPGETQISMQLWSTNDRCTRKLITDYLKAVHSHVERMLLQNVTEAALRRTEREYVITVPAVWKEKARNLAAKCTIDAGMGPQHRLHIITEPKAAAMYAISTFKEINTGGLENGDTFVLCDAGGGYSYSYFFDIVTIIG